jgi:SAM-dependent methyltransferase
MTNGHMPEVSPDTKAHREWLLSLLPVQGSMSVVDLGCGAGHDLIAFAQAHPDIHARFIGLDSSEKSLESALRQSRDDPRICFVRHDLKRPLPFGPATVDAVFTNNTLECLSEPVNCAREIGRILRPGGTVVAAHWDWDSQLFDGGDKARIRRLVHAFADWQQPWMEHSDGWMGRRLRRVFASTGCFDGSMYARVPINTTFEVPWYGHSRAQDMSALARRSLVPAEDVAGFLEEQTNLHAQGRYFYCITGLAYVGTRCPSSVGVR